MRKNLLEDGLTDKDQGVFDKDVVVVVIDNSLVVVPVDKGKVELLSHSKPRDIVNLKVKEDNKTGR